MADDNPRDLYIRALKNTHALEQQALQIMERQVERLDQYPEMEQALRRHIQETHGQRDRLEEALLGFNEKPSALKEGVLGFVGNMASLTHAGFGDEILKDTYANHAFENFEVAAYKSLLTIAEIAGERSTAGFEQSLREEQAMARFIHDNVEAITRKYASLAIAGEKAKI
jgi:ferritin-like metal-binding protein YciE